MSRKHTIINLLLFSIYTFLFHYTRRDLDYNGVLYVGGLAIIVFSSSKLISRFSYKQNTISIKMINSKQYNFKLILIIIAGIIIFINYGFSIFQINKDIDLIILIVGIIIVLECFNRFRREIVFNDKIIGVRYIDLFLQYSKIRAFKINKLTLELSSSFRFFNLRFNDVSPDSRAILIDCLNNNLSTLFGGNLSIRDNEIVINNAA